MRLTARSLPLVLAAFGAVASAGASSFSATNGKLIYVVSGKGPSHIVASNADGSNLGRLTRPVSPLGDFAPRVSADGTRAVFVRGTTKIHQIWIVGIRRHRAHEVKVTGLPPKTLPFAPTFTPNGRAIIFELDKDQTAVGIWRVASKGGKATRLIQGAYAGPTVSPNGRKLAFYTDSMLGFGKVKTATITGKNVRTIVGGGTTLAVDPDFSPDGRHLAVVLIGEGGGWDIAIIPSAGGDPTYLTSSATDERNFGPAFSPDGTTVAFVHSVEGNNGIEASEIDSVPVAGGSTSVLVPTSANARIFGLDWQRKPSG